MAFILIGVGMNFDKAKKHNQNISNANVACLNFVTLICKSFEEYCSDDIAIIILDKKQNIFYKTSNANLFMDRYPNLQNDIAIIINKEIIGVTKLEKYSISSYKMQDIAKKIEYYYIFIKNDVSIKDKVVFDVTTRCCHDIQEPLRSISNFLQLINLESVHEDDGKQKIRKYVSYALDNVQKLRTWTNDLLNSASKPNTEVKVKIQDIVSEIKELLTSHFSSRLCSIIVQDDLYLVVKKREDLVSLFKNLIENSLRHAICNNCELKIMINENVEDSKDGMICINYEDNGSLPLCNHKKDELNGNDSHGIGLAICKQIAESNNWRIQNELDDNNMKIEPNKCKIYFEKN